MLLDSLKVKAPVARLYNPAAFALYLRDHEAFRDQNDHDQNDHFRWAGEDVRVESNVT